MSRTSTSAGRVAKGALAFAALLVALVGIPWLLIKLAGNPLPTHPSVSGLWHALSTPDDGSILISLIAVVAWVAWLVFAVSVLAELIALLSRQRIRIRLPGLGGPQKLAGGLILLVLAVFVGPQQIAAAQPVPTGPATESPTVTATTPDRADRAPAAPEDRVRPDARRSTGESTDSKSVQHRVREGDDLWSLAEHYYGKGDQWRRIAHANPSVLSGGPDRLEPGWTLRIPGVEQGPRRVRVQTGDSLSSIAERHYGDSDQWPRIHRANADRVTDPDELTVGQELIIPADVATDPGDSAEASGSSHSTGSQDQQRQRSDAEDGSAGSDGPSDAPSAGGKATESSGAPSSAGAPAQDRRTGAEDRDVGSAPGVGSAGGADANEPEPLPVRGAEIPPMALQVTGVGAVLAAALVGGLFTRRQLQLRGRGVGRRIRQPQPAAQQLRATLGRQQNRFGIEHLNLALRAIGRECRQHERPLPELLVARVAEGLITLTMAAPDLPVPVGFTCDGTEWRLTADDADYLIKDAELADCMQPYPTLTSLGTDATGAVVLINLEAAGMLALDGAEIGSRVRGAMAAMVTELSMTPWADDLVITVVGGDDRLVSSIDRYNVGSVADLDQLLQQWEQRASLQRTHLTADGDLARSPVDLRIDPDLADPWLPEVALIMDEPDPSQTERLQQLLLDGPAVTMAAVVLGDHPVGWRVHYVDLGEDGAGGELSPLGWRFAAQLLDDEVCNLVEELVDSSGSELTEPAPWWAEDFPAGTHPPQRATAAGIAPARVVDIASLPSAMPRSPIGAGAGDDRSHDQLAPVEVVPEDQDQSPDDHDQDIDGDDQGPPPEVDQDQAEAAGSLWPSAAARSTGAADAADPVAASDELWAWLAPMERSRTQPDAASEETVIVPRPFADPPPGPRHPTIMLLGPIELLGTAGTRPGRAVLQCVEYASWLLEHPASTAQAMTGALVVAEGTRRSNMSRLRSWLGSDDHQEPYLPDAYSGRIVLSPLVSSDWHRLQLLTATGVNRTSTEGLCKALELVRGAPLADAAPGQWHWAEEMRTDMVSVIRDIGVELTGRALQDSDLDLARWAASRSLTAAPQDEFLMGARIRTEHQAGNPAEVERLSLQLAAHGRALGVDLHPETVDLLQQVVEGRLRARA